MAINSNPLRSTSHAESPSSLRGRPFARSTPTSKSAPALPILQLPFLIYHIPGRAAVSVAAETFEAIAERRPNFVGLKNTDDDLALVSRLISRVEQNPIGLHHIQRRGKDFGIPAG